MEQIVYDLYIKCDIYGDYVDKCVPNVISHSFDKKYGDLVCITLNLNINNKIVTTSTKRFSLGQVVSKYPRWLYNGKTVLPLKISELDKCKWGVQGTKTRIFTGRRWNAKHVAKTSNT